MLYVQYIGNEEANSRQANPAVIPFTFGGRMSRQYVGFRASEQGRLSAVAVALTHLPHTNIFCTESEEKLKKERERERKSSDSLIREFLSPFLFIYTNEVASMAVNKFSIPLLLFFLLSIPRGWNQ